ncbi:hypothetical protein BH18ACT15_BH18ACT15_03070 [soil metagenome]
MATAPCAGTDQALREPELLARATGGDIEAYEELVRLTEVQAHRVAHSITRNRADAEDVTQCAFLNAYVSFRRCRASTPFRPWLMRIVTNEALDNRRSAGRRARLARRIDGETRGKETGPDPCAQWAEARERSTELTAALRRLSDRDREIMALLAPEERSCVRCVRGAASRRRRRI